MSKESIFNLFEFVRLSVSHATGKLNFAARIEDLSEESASVELNDLAPDRVDMIKPGARIRGNMARPDALYHFESKALRTFEDKKQRLLEFQLPERMEREQRRRFFRVDRRMECQLSIVSKDQEDGESVDFSGRIINIGAGGVKVVAQIPMNLRIKAGDQLVLNFNLDTQTHFELVYGEVMRMEAGKGGTHFAVIFLKPHDEMQNEITRHNILYERKYLLGRIQDETTGT